MKIPSPSGQPVAPGTGLDPLEMVPGCVPCQALQWVIPERALQGLVSLLLVKGSNIMCTGCEMVSPTLTPSFCLILAGVGFNHNQYLHTDMVKYWWGFFTGGVNKSQKLATEGLKWEVRHIFSTYCISACGSLSKKVVDTPSQDCISLKMCSNSSVDLWN